MRDLLWYDPEAEASADAPDRVLSHPDPTKRARAAMKRDLPAFMLPKIVELRSEFPKNPNGKIDRTLLVAEIEERHA